MLDGKAVYACGVLAIEAQGKEIQTVESLSEGGRYHPVIKAFVDNDAQQCGFCTPGFVMAAKAFLEQTPDPTYEQVKAGLGGQSVPLRNLHGRAEGGFAGRQRDERSTACLIPPITVGRRRRSGG